MAGPSPECAAGRRTFCIYQTYSKPKFLYKKAFIPYFTDTTPMPPVTTTISVPILPTMRDSNILHYDDWTDYAIEYYGQRHSTTPTVIPKRKRVLRQSSTIRSSQKVSAPATTTPSRSPATTKPNGAQAPTDELRRSPSSKYEFQYSSYHQQHTAYWKHLDEPRHELHYCTHRYFGYSLRDNMENKGDRALNGMDIKGRTKHYGRSLLHTLDHRIQSMLYYEDPASWKLHLQLLQLCLNTYSTKQTFGSGTTNSTVSQSKVRSYKSPPHIGLGIAHFSFRHRIQRRAQRVLKSIVQKASAPNLRLHSPSFVHSLAKFPSTTLARPDLSAPSLRQQQQFTASIRDSLSHAPSLGQHLSVYRLPNPLLPEDEIAPTFFRPQHSFNPCNIVVPPAFSLGSLTNPDGPSNILLFDLTITLAYESLGNPCNTLIGISNILFFPYSHWLFSCFDPPGHRRHMGNQLYIYRGISNPVHFPHALVFNSCSIPCITEFQNINQETVKRANQKPGQWPTCPIGPGHYLHFDPTRVQKNMNSKGPHSLHLISSFIRPFRPPPHRMFSSNTTHGDPRNAQHWTFSPLWTILCGDQHWHELDFALHLWTALLWDVSIAPLVHCDFVSSLALLDSRSFGRCTERTYEKLERHSCTEISEDYRVHRSSGCNSLSSLTTFIAPECQSKPPFTTQESTDSPHSLLSFPAYGLSLSQLQTLLHNHHLHQCILFPNLMDWLCHLSHSNDSTGIFYYNHHWYTFAHSQRQIQVLVSSRQDPILPLLTTLIQALPCFHTFSLTLNFAPPTPRGLCGLMAISVLQYLFQISATTFPMVQRNGNAFFWKDMSAISELHYIYEGFLEITNKHFIFGPVGYMETDESPDLEDNVFNTTDTMSPSLPSLLSNTFGIPLIPPNFSHEPITYCLHLTDSELADQLDFGSFLEQRIVYFHFDQSLHMDCFHLQDTIPPETFSSKWEEIYPCYPSSYIQKLLLWDNFLQTWTPSSFALIDTISTNCHLRIHFHTKWVHVDFPLTKRSFRVEITPLWTIQHIVDTLRITLGHSSFNFTLTQQGRVLPSIFDPWRALPSYTLQPQHNQIPPVISTHQGRQHAKPLRYCTCNTWCNTTHELTKRAHSSFGNPQITICFFRHPINNHLFVLPICSITTPTHVHSRYLPYNAVFWIPVVNDTFVSMDSILAHYGTPVTLEFYELPLTRGTHTDTLYGTSLFHLKIQDPGAVAYRPFKRIVLQPTPHLHRYVDVPLIIEPTFTVEEIEHALETFLRYNIDLLQPPRSQPPGILIRNTSLQTYQVFVGEDPYAIKHNLYNPLFPKMATRPYPPNPDYWMISDQFCSFLHPVPKTLDYTFRDVFYDCFRCEDFDYTCIRSIIFNNETWHLYDIVPLSQSDRITYVLTPVRLDLHLHEINTHVYLTVSPLTQIMRLKQLLETYTHISKHHNVLPYADNDYVMILPRPTFIGFPPNDRSDSATLASQVTEFSSLSCSTDHAHPAIDNDPQLFSNIPLHYWVTDIDINYIFSNLLQIDLAWFAPQSFLQGEASSCSNSSFLTVFVHESHWYACFYSHVPPKSHSLPTATLFIPPYFPPFQRQAFVHKIEPLLPLCNLSFHPVTTSLEGLCGITLVQCLMNWLISHPCVPLQLRIRCLEYSSFDFTHLALFFQSSELRRRNPHAPHLFTYRAGAIPPPSSSPPDNTTAHIADTTLPTNPTPDAPALSGPTPYGAIHSCREQERLHHLLSATQLNQYPQAMRSLPILQLPPSIGTQALRNIFPEQKPPIPPQNKIHILIMAQDAVWRKYAILPNTFNHSQRLQYLLPGLRPTLYEHLDYNVHDAWVSLINLNATTSEPYIQYRLQFKKFLIPIHIYQTRHTSLLEVWPWFTIQDVVQLLQVIFHLPTNSITPANHPLNTVLATIPHRLLQTFNFYRSTTTLNYSLDFPLPPDVLLHSRCWCCTTCTHTVLTSINTERSRQALYLNLMFAILPTSRQLILINQCQSGTFEQLLTYLLPQRTNSAHHLVLCGATIYPLQANLPKPEQASCATFVHLPRSCLRLPTVDNHLEFFRYAAESDFQHSELIPITIQWHVSTTNPPLVRQVYTLPLLTLRDLSRTIANFSGPHHVVNITPNISQTTLLSQAPQPVTFTITHLSHHEYDHRSIESLEAYLAENLSPLPRERWFTENDILIFQNHLRHTYSQLTTVPALNFQTLCLQTTDTTWATAVVFMETWLPVYYDSVLTTLIIGMPISWLHTHKQSIVDQLQPTFTHIQTRPLPNVPEGYCGPLAVANLFFWSGYDQCTSPLDQLKRITQEAWSQPNRNVTNQTARLIAGGPKPIDATRPPELSPEILHQAFMLTFFPHTREPQLYSLAEAQVENRLTSKRYMFFDDNFFRPLFLSLPSGPADRHADPSFNPSPYTPLLSTCFSLTIDQDEITFRCSPLLSLTDDQPYDFESQPPVPLQFSSHHLDLLFRFLFPHNRFHWVHPEHFMTYGAHFAHINYKWVTFFIAQQHWVAVYKLLPNFHAYHFLVPVGLPASHVTQRFLELTHIPPDELRSRGDFFPSTPPGLCGPAAALTLLRKFKHKHFSQTKYFLEKSSNHLMDYSRHGIFEVLRYAAALDTLFPPDPNDIFSSAGGNLSCSPTQPTQELIQRTLLRRRLTRYMTPLTPDEYLTNEDIDMFIPFLQEKYQQHSIHIISGPRSFLLPLSQFPDCIVFYTTPHTWQAYQKTQHQIIQYVTEPTHDIDPPNLFPPWTNLECIQFLLRPHSPGWNGFNLLAHLLNGYQTLENTMDLFHQIKSQRTLATYRPLFNAGSSLSNFTNQFIFHPLPRHFWINNQQLDVLLHVFLPHKYDILPCELANNFIPPPPTKPWIVVLSHCDHWFPFLFHPDYQCLFVDSSSLYCPIIFRYFQNLFSRYQLYCTAAPNLASGWCGLAALIFLDKLLTQLPPPMIPFISRRTIDTLCSTGCVCHGGTWDTVLDTNDPSMSTHGRNDTIATTVPFELQLGPETQSEEPLREDQPQRSVP